MMLVVDNVVFSWEKQDGKVPFINNLSVAYKSGHPYLLYGPSGAGKSTMGQLFAGLLSADRGQITLEGKPVSECLSQIAYVFQFPETLFFEDTIDNEIKEQMGSDRCRLDYYAERVGIDYKKQGSKSPYKLSGGQARLFALILQLSRETKIIIVDEPTAGLDWKYSSKVSQLLKEWCVDDKILIVITHDLELMGRLQGTSYCIESGTIRWVGPTTDLIDHSDLLRNQKYPVK